MLLFHCRPGFEADCAAELTARALEGSADGRPEYRSGEAYVVWLPSHGIKSRPWLPDFSDLVFARQMLEQCRTVPLDEPADRLTSIVEVAKRMGQRFATVWLEAPDADRPRQMLSGMRGFQEALEQALLKHGVLGGGRRSKRLHVCLIDRDSAVLGVSSPSNGSPWPMGIPRLRFPAGAPSRSGLKLVEALATFFTEDELLGRMRAGRVAIDLGAAPGGWSQVLASRGLRVIAVDNGPIAQGVLDTQLVEHRREDAFRFRPDLPVDWMVCDVVAAPSRIAALAAQWIARGWCRETIFNLKLPNANRWQEIVRCHGVIEKGLTAAKGDHALRIKHLYHDREEVTAHLRRM
jgi:23S rRNA (cytidine2498-2'-O)-methyltransferase